MNHDFHHLVVLCREQHIEVVDTRGQTLLVRARRKVKAEVEVEREDRGKIPGPQFLASNQLRRQPHWIREGHCSSFLSHSATAAYSTMSFVSRGARAAARPLRRSLRQPPRRFAGHEAGHGHGDAHHSGESALHVAGGSGQEGFGVSR